MCSVVDFELQNRTFELLSIGSFRDIKIQLDNEAEKTQTKESINLLVRFPLFLSLIIKLNFNISKGPYPSTDTSF